MKDLVFLQNEQAVTTSLKVAEVFEKRHDRVLRAIENAIFNLPKNGDVKKSFIKSTYTDEKGEKRPMYYLNRDGFTFVAMGFTGQKAAEFKWAYIQAFNKMEKALASRALDFQAMRQITVDSTKHLHKVIQEVVIPTARANGSTTADSIFHSHYEKLINKTIGVPAGQRPKLSYGLQSDIARLDEVIEANIVKKAQSGATHREIYASTKDTVKSYAEAALLNERADAHKFVEVPKQAVNSVTIQISLF